MQLNHQTLGRVISVIAPAAEMHLLPSNPTQSDAGDITQGQASPYIHSFLLLTSETTSQQETDVLDEGSSI